MYLNKPGYHAAVREAANMLGDADEIDTEYARGLIEMIAAMFTEPSDPFDGEPEMEGRVAYARSAVRDLLAV